jgi:transposase
VRQGLRFLRHQLPDILAACTDVLSPRMVRILEDLVCDWSHLDERIENVTDEIDALARGDASCRQLMTVPGTGPIICERNGSRDGQRNCLCKRARLCGVARPGAEADVHRTILGRITKCGNRYLRTLFMQGARVILLRPVNWAKHSFGLRLTAAAQRLLHNVLATALANKLARIAWTVLAQGRSYEATKRASSQKSRIRSTWSDPLRGCPRLIPDATENAQLYLPRSASWIEETVSPSHP